MHVKLFAYAGIIWTLLFAGMSFYWAAGGMLGVRSLGGEIYQRALEQDPSFVPIVWATGVIKLGGVILLWLVIMQVGPDPFRKTVMVICIVVGVLMALYGLLNMLTISLAAFGILNFQLDAYATGWRLAFWEPFWILGGVLYILTAVKSWQ